MKNRYASLALIASILALCVVMIGAYTRLSDAGLGCPDWPGCYGHLTVPTNPSDIAGAEKHFPGMVVEAAKAWKEMIHRYVAATLGILILVLAVWGGVRKRAYPRQPLILPLFLVFLVLFQAALGMWTVTWKVLPLVVSAHLLGGLALVALLWYLHLKTRPQNTLHPVKALGFRPWAILGICILGLQIGLGAWTSTTYSALACQDFPYCHGSLFPPLDLKQAFQLFHPIGINYEGGVLETPVRITIQMMHRYGAFFTALYLASLSIAILWRRDTEGLRATAATLLLLLIVQILLGIANVMMQLPLGIAVAHNGVAAVLLMTLVTLLYQLKSPRTSSALHRGMGI
jgi:cytochrome c oxidase assembly protein subunit 15